MLFRSTAEEHRKAECKAQEGEHICSERALIGHLVRACAHELHAQVDGELAAREAEIGDTVWGACTPCAALAEFYCLTLPGTWFKVSAEPIYRSVAWPYNSLTRRDCFLPTLPHRAASGELRGTTWNEVCMRRVSITCGNIAFSQQMQRLVLFLASFSPARTPNS